MTTSTKPLHGERVEEPAKALWEILGRIEAAAFEIRPPNRHTPKILQLVDQAREIVGAFPEGQRP